MECRELRTRVENDGFVMSKNQKKREKRFATMDPKSVEGSVDSGANNGKLVVQ